MRLSKLEFIVLVLAFTSAVSAAPIFVNNASFETLPAGGLPNSCGAGCSYSTSAQGIPGWTVGLSGGVAEPGASTALLNFVPDGSRIGYAEDGALTQTTAATVQLGITYVLLVDIGLRKDRTSFGSANLIIGGTTLIAATGAAPTSGGWSTFTATYTGLAGDVGKTIGIALNPAQQGDYDNVRLSNNVPATGVPEPATWSLMATGLLVAVIGRRVRS